MEFSDHRRQAERAFVEIDEVDAPLVRLGIVEAEGLRLDALLLVGGGDVEFFEVGIAVEKFVVIGDAVVLDPGVGAVQAIGEAADVRFPVAD